MNRLQFFDAGDPAALQGTRNLLVTGPDHPYSNVFWKPGHIIGYEHTFIATLGDFLRALDRTQPFYPNFQDALETQKVMAAVEVSAASGGWTTVGMGVKP
jgi:hypothetical protein